VIPSAAALDGLAHAYGVSLEALTICQHADKEEEILRSLDDPLTIVLAAASHNARFDVLGTALSGSRWNALEEAATRFRERGASVSHHVLRGAPRLSGAHRVVHRPGDQTSKYLLAGVTSFLFSPSAENCAAYAWAEMYTPYALIDRLSDRATNELSACLNQTSHSTCSDR